MRNIWAIAKREFNLYFVSPVAYMVAAAFLLMLGIILQIFIGFAMQQGYYGSAPSPADVIGTFFTVFLLIGASSALTMRLFAEEQRTGTLELLMTAPLREWEVVVGKWLAAFGLIAVLFVISLIYPLILNYYTLPGIDWQATAAAYVGLLLVAGGLLAIGVFSSSLFGNQIAAFLVTLVVEIALWLFTYLASSLTGTVGEIFKHLAFFEHYYEKFNQGTVDLTSIVFYLSVIVIFLFLAVRMVESRRWR